MKFSTGIAIVFLMFSAPAFSGALIRLAAFQNGSCETFGSGWSEFAYDARTNIKYCKQISSTVPPTAIADVRGIYPGNNTGCNSLGAGWSEFAYDGSAKVRYCNISGSTGNTYITDIAAVLGIQACETLSGRGWDLLVFNGNSNIAFCGKFSN